MGPRAGLDRCGKSRPCGDSIRSARSQSVYRLSYPAHLFVVSMGKNKFKIVKNGYNIVKIERSLRGCVDGWPPVLLPQMISDASRRLAQTEYRNISCHREVSPIPDPTDRGHNIVPSPQPFINTVCKQTPFYTRNYFLFLPTLTFRHRASCILGQAFHYSPENAFYIFNQQIYFII